MEVGKGECDVLFAKPLVLVFCQSTGESDGLHHIDDVIHSASAHSCVRVCVYIYLCECYYECLIVIMVMMKRAPRKEAASLMHTSVQATEAGR